MWMPLRLTVDVRRHARVPAVGLVAEVDAGFEQLAQSELGKSHLVRLTFSGFASDGEKSLSAQPVDARGCLPRGARPRLWI